MSEVFGTADILIRWSMPDPLTLRGSGQTFYVQIFYDGTLRGEVQVDELSVFLNSSVGVVNGRVQNIAVSYMYMCSVGIFVGIAMKISHPILLYCNISHSVPIYPCLVESCANKHTLCTCAHLTRNASFRRWHFLLNITILMALCLIIILCVHAGDCVEHCSEQHRNTHRSNTMATGATTSPNQHQKHNSCCESCA